jgi:hypothetical protein
MKVLRPDYTSSSTIAYRSEEMHIVELVPLLSDAGMHHITGCA